MPICLVLYATLLVTMVPIERYNENYSESKTSEYRIQAEHLMLAMMEQ